MKLIMASASTTEVDYKSVVVILDASRDDSLGAIGEVLPHFSLKSRDNLTLLAVLHQVNSPSTFPFMKRALKPRKTYTHLLLFSKLVHRKGKKKN